MSDDAAAAAPSTLAVLGIGNPLLDISAEVKPELLAKYELQPSNAILCEDKHKPLYEELVKSYDVAYTAGGSCLNSMRMGQWFAAEPQTFGYLGCVGDDEYAKKLRAAVEADRVCANFHVDASVPTGTCAALITNAQRSLVANLSAANKYVLSHAQAPRAQAMLAAARVLYATSFFLTVSPESAELFGKHALEHNKPFAMNLSAPFLLEVPMFAERVRALLPYADYVFCNNHEADALAKAQDWPAGDLKGAAERLAKMEKKNAKRERVVIFTCGPEPAIVYRDGAVHEYAPIKLADGQLVDENGAGDAYLGGFLAGLAADKSFDEAMAQGCYAAYLVIQQHGAALPAARPRVTHNGFTFGDAPAAAAAAGGAGAASS